MRIRDAEFQPVYAAAFQYPWQSPTERPYKMIKSFWEYFQALSLLFVLCRVDVGYEEVLGVLGLKNKAVKKSHLDQGKI